MPNQWRKANHYAKIKPMLTEKQIAWNMRGVQNAIAQQELEGLPVSQEMRDDFQRIAHGELTTTDALRKALAPFANAQILKL